VRRYAAHAHVPVIRHVPVLHREPSVLVARCWT